MLLGLTASAGRQVLIRARQIRFIQVSTCAHPVDYCGREADTLIPFASNRHGQPIWSRRGLTPQFSFSRSFDYCVPQCNDHPIGIDVEKCVICHKPSILRKDFSRRRKAVLSRFGERPNGTHSCCGQTRRQRSKDGHQLGAHLGRIEFELDPAGPAAWGTAHPGWQKRSILPSYPLAIQWSMSA